MLRRLHDLGKCVVTTNDDEEIGNIDDFYFDDEQWTVRYVVVKTGNWLTGRTVLVSPMSVDRVEWNEKRLRLRLTRQQIQAAPDADLERPISRQWEVGYSSSYGLPYYWPGTGVWGAWPTPYAARAAIDTAPSREQVASDGNHLRSAREVSGYHIDARNGEIGHVEDFLLDDDTWKIRYLMVDTSNWIGGRTVLIAPEWTDRIEWTAQRVYVDATREDVKNAPKYRPAAEIDSRYHDQLADIYHRPVRPI
jgi:sporulation protein YlmC with PRC-barrel domain